MVIYQMMNGKIFKKTLSKMIKAYYMCAQNGVVYKGYTELTGDNLAYVRRYISGKCADRRINSKNIDEGCGTDELDIVWLNDSLLLIAEKDAVVQGRTLNRAFYRLPVNNETDKKSTDVLKRSGSYETARSIANPVNSADCRPKDKTRPDPT